MSDHITVLAYGPVEPGLTLRRFADRVKAHLELLKRLHPAFDVQYYVIGDKASAVFPVARDFSNLDELIYQWAWDKKDKRAGKYEKTNPDGTPSWDSPATGIGYTLSLGTNEKGEFSYRHGSVDTRISLGGGGGLPNKVSIQLPLPDDPLFVHRDIYAFPNIKRFAVAMIDYWRPWYFRVYEGDFSDLVDFEYGSDLYRENYGISWMTYIERPAIADLLPEDVGREVIGGRGVLFWLNEDIRSVIDQDRETVEKAIRIRDLLFEHGLLREIRS